jgi:O-methyltransferase involved in polyketide biosynthesis
MIDVLHYLDEAEQRALLQRAAAAVGEGGRVLVRESDGTRTGGAWTRWLERVATKRRWNRAGAGLHFRSIDSIADDLRALGFDVRIASVSGKLHPGNAMVVAQPRAPS